MKNTQKFIVEIILTLIVVALLVAVAQVIALFIIGNVGTVTDDVLAWVNGTGFTLGGILIGYKLKTLMIIHKK